MNFSAYRLRFKAPLHIDAQGIGHEETEIMVHSDTLFSALMCLWRNFYDDDIEALCESPRFHLSSAFPYAGEASFFPSPMCRLLPDKTGDKYPEIGKKLKKMKFISRSLFEKTLNGEKWNYEDTETLQDGLFWRHQDERSWKKEFIFRKQEIPRIAVDRWKQSTEIFYFSRVHFAVDAGLFFLVRFDDDAIKRKFETVLRLLGDEGLGGDKNAGHGQFEPEEWEGFELKTPENGDYFITLSLYHPKKEEFGRDVRMNSSYGIVSRQGRLHPRGLGMLRRKEVNMLIAGSVIQYPAENANGKLGDCCMVLEKDSHEKLKHNVYRYGYAFDLPIIIREPDNDEK